jgi:membrane-associated phospholipid phosphatase
MFTPNLFLVLALSAPSVTTPAPASATWTDAGVIAGAAGALALMHQQKEPWSALDWEGTETGQSYKEDYVPTWAMGLTLAGLTAGAATEGGTKEAVTLLQGTGLTLMLSDLIKYSVGRPRPDYDDRMRIYNAGGQDEKMSWDARLSMPSGHSAMAMAMAWHTVFWWDRAACRRGTEASGKPLRWGVPLAVGSAIAYSRFPNNRHKLSDVAVGSAIGTAVAFAVNHVQFPGGCTR